jgi:hypothetical protein
MRREPFQLPLAALTRLVIKLVIEKVVRKLPISQVCYPEEPNVRRRTARSTEKGEIAVVGQVGRIDVLDPQHAVVPLLARGKRT